ncbi:hypothetical protein ACFSTC_11920 [Nonomuraea ferruginea]
MPGTSIRTGASAATHAFSRAATSRAVSSGSSPSAVNPFFRSDLPSRYSSTLPYGEIREVVMALWSKSGLPSRSRAGSLRHRLSQGGVEGERGQMAGGVPGRERGPVSGVDLQADLGAHVQRGLGDVHDQPVPAVGAAPYRDVAAQDDVAPGRAGAGHAVEHRQPADGAPVGGLVRPGVVEGVERGLGDDEAVPLPHRHGLDDRGTATDMTVGKGDDCRVHGRHPGRDTRRSSSTYRSRPAYKPVNSCATSTAKISRYGSVHPPPTSRSTPTSSGLAAA